MQKYTSKNTSINSTKLPAIFNKLNWAFLEQISDKLMRPLRLLDVGAGKYTIHIREFCRERGVKYYPYDPYNQYGVVNKYALNCKPDLIVCSNVLNVIDSDCVVENLHNAILSYYCPYFITVYEGDRTGVGKSTKKDCYQRNERIRAYARPEEIVLNNIITHNDYKNYII